MEKVILLKTWLLVGCAAAACSNDSLDHNVERYRTIEHGVYGQLIRGCDTFGCDDSYGNGIQAAAFPVATTNFAVQPIDSFTANEQGFYQLALESGTYLIAVDATTSDDGFTSGAQSTEVTLAGEIIRRDWTSGPGGGHWSQP